MVAVKWIQVNAYLIMNAYKVNVYYKDTRIRVNLYTYIYINVYIYIQANIKVIVISLCDRSVIMIRDNDRS